MLSDLDFHARNHLVIFNKVDRLTHDEQAAVEEGAFALLGSHVFTSTIEEGGLEPLRSALREALRQRWPTVVLTLPAVEGRILAEIYREGEVLQREERGERISVTARLPEQILGRLREHQDVTIFEAHPAA